MRRIASLGLALFLSVIAVNVSAACGVERWSIKTGTDAGAPSINLGTYISSTIYNFHQSARPGSIPSNSRVSPRETTQYRLSGTLTKYKRETDSDYHLVIQDSAGRTMIIELPSINCVGGGSPFGSGISHARAQFDARFTATTTMKTTSTPVTIKGIGFWDFLHGQTGVAPNGIEVHPVLDITFGSSAAFAPAISSIDDLENTQLPADVVRDDDGGLVQVYRGGDAVSDAVLYHGGEILQDPSLSMVFLGKHDVRTVAQFARELRTDSLDRYGVRNFGLRVTTRELPSADITTDLDVQRALADAIESGRIQHNDENAIYVVMLEPGIDAAVGSTRDFLSYHSQFHPTDLAMRYVVVRGGLDAATTREAMFASIERAMVNPGGNGWF